MKRRGFFQALAGIAAAPIAAKLAPMLPAPAKPIAPVGITPEFAAGYAINLREMVQRDMGRWFARRMDDCMFAALTGEEPRA